jgi:hypothetical protein
MEEGYLDVTDPDRTAPLVVVQYKAQENNILVVQRFRTAYFDYLEGEDPDMIECPDACQVGRLGWSPEIAKRPHGTATSQFIRQDGYYGATPPAAPIDAASKTGISYTGYLNIRTCPLIVPEGKTFQIQLYIHDLDAGLPIIEGYKRSFYAQFVGFELPTV